MTDLMTIEAEAHTPIASAQLTRFNLPALNSTYLDESRHWLDMCLTPRPSNTQARFQDRWSPHRFERLGRAFLAPRGEAIQFRTDGGPQASIVCKFDPDAVSDWLQEDASWPDQRMDICLDIGDDRVCGLLRRLAEEMRGPGFAGPVMIDLLLQQVMIELVRFWKMLDESPAGGGLAPWRLRRIEERLAEVREAPTLAELAEACNMSVRHLSRAFRASRGCSIGDHVAQSRIEMAKRLLAGDDCIKAIAGSMGFSSASHFSHAFRRETGLTPRLYRLNSDSRPH
jgi:AraC family transcriptional regulator